MNLRRIGLIIVTVAVAVFLINELLRRRVSVQVPATFARLAQAIEDRDAADVMATVDRSYDFSGKWPQLFVDKEKGRADAQRLLALAFIHSNQAQESITCTWTVHRYQEKPDGTIDAEVSLHIAGGAFTGAVPPLDHHHFYLRKSSALTGFYRIYDHAEFILNVPSM